MRGIWIWVALSLGACGAPPQTSKPKEAPKSAPIEVLPVSTPNTKPASAPTTLSASTQTTTQGALLAIAPTTAEAPVTWGSAFLLECDADEYRGRDSFVVEHPDPAIKKRINAMVRSKTSAGGCYSQLCSSSVISFVCFSEETEIDPMQSRTPGGSYVEPTTYNFWIKDSVLVPILAEEVFLDVNQTAERGSIDNSGWLDNSIDLANFTIEDDGVSFFITGTPVGQKGSAKTIRYEEHPGDFLLARGPLATLKELDELSSLEEIESYQRGLTLLPFDPKAPPTSMVVYGTIIDGAHWIDTAGENYLLITEREAASKKDPTLLSRYMNAYHYKKSVVAPTSMPASEPASAPTSAPTSAPAEVITNVRTVFTKEEHCAAKNFAGLVKGSIAVTDVDLDGVGEVSFAALLGCGEEGSSASLSVYLLESGGKYSLTGPSKSAEEIELVPSGPFQSVSENFKAFLELRWDTFAE